MKNLFLMTAISFSIIMNIQLQYLQAETIDSSKTVTFQGFLTDSNNTAVLDGTYDLTFSLWDGDDSANDKKLWEETHESVVVQKGIFSISLGQKTSFPYTITFTQPCYIGTQIDEGDIMEPLIPLTSTWTSFRSLTSGGKKVQDINQNYDLTDADDILFASGAITITLPSVSSIQKGRVFSILKADSGTTTQIKTKGTETINGVNYGTGEDSLSMEEQYAQLTIINDGQAWLSPTFSFGLDSVTLSSLATSARSITFPDASGYVLIQSETGDVSINNALYVSGPMQVNGDSFSLSKTTFKTAASSPHTITFPNSSGTVVLASGSSLTLSQLSVSSLLDASKGAIHAKDLSVSNLSMMNDADVTVQSNSSGVSITSDKVKVTFKFGGQEDSITAENPNISISGGSLDFTDTAFNGSIVSDGLSISGPLDLSEFTASSANITHLVITGSNSLIVRDTFECEGDATFYGLATFGTLNASGNVDIDGGLTIDGSSNLNTVFAAYIETNSLNVKTNLTKPGGSFKIDHPLDPENKYLFHSFVESPDMMNIYNGIITTDDSGLAIVQLPDYFEALNKDFRYQLTCIGSFAQAIILEKIENNRFTIQTDFPDIEVSWQVTGIRKDAFAEDNRIQVEVEKPDSQKGTYLYQKK